MIIWFSGSGNSLAIARKIAQRTSDKLMPLHEAVRTDLSAEESIGLVYPTYWLDAPLAIRAHLGALNGKPFGHRSSEKGLFEITQAASETAAFVGGEGNHGLAGQVVSLQESGYAHRVSSPPAGPAKVDGIVF